jgi:hypothetical protein
MSQERKKYKIQTFNVREICESLFSCSGDLVLTEEETESATIRKVDGSNTYYESPLLRQLIITKMEKENHDDLDLQVAMATFENDHDVRSDLEDIIVFFDFSDLFDQENELSTSYDAVVTDIFHNGVTLTINGKKNRFLPFENSGGQRRASVLSFVREDYADAVRLRIMMGMPLNFICKDGTPHQWELSKLFAYNGLTMSDGYRIEDDLLQLDETSLVVVPDQRLKTEYSYITAFDYEDALSYLKSYLSTSLCLEAGQRMEAIADDYFGPIKPNDIGANIVKTYVIPFYLTQASKAYGVYRKQARETDEDHTQLVKEFLENYVKSFVQNPTIQPDWRDLFAKGDADFDVFIAKKLLPDLNQRLLASFNASDLPEDEIKTKRSHLIDVDKGLVSYKAFDGEGLVLPEISKVINNHYSQHKGKPGQDHTSFQIRMPYMKGMIHTTDFESFFSEKHDLFGSDPRLILDGTDERRVLAEKEAKKPFVLTNNKGEKIYYLVDYLGIPRDVSKIKIILTEGQFKGAKWLKTYLESLPQEEQEKYMSSDALGRSTIDVLKYYFVFFKKYRHALYISQSNKLDKLDNSITRLNYQFLSTSGLSKEDIESIFSGSSSKKPVNAKRYTNLITNETDQIECLGGIGEGRDEALEDINVTDGESISSESPFALSVKEERERVNKALALAITKNPALLKDPFIKAKLKEVADGYLEDLKLCRLEVGGENRYLCSDLLQLLYHCLGADDVYLKQPKSLRKTEFYAPEKTDELYPSNPGVSFDVEKGYAILRNPHIVPNEDGYLFPWLYLKDKTTERYKYFHKLTGVVMVNPESLIPDRLGGADFDGDMVKIIDDDIYNNSISKHFSFEKPILAKDIRAQKLKQVPGYELIKIPSEEPNKSMFTPKNVKETIINSFASHVGSYCDDAFGYSNFAFSNMDEIIDDEDVIKRKEQGRELAQLYLIIIGLEIDAAKNGKRPLKPENIKGYFDFDLGAKQFKGAKLYLKIKNKTGEGAKKSKEDAKNDKDQEIINRYSLQLPPVPYIFAKATGLRKEVSKLVVKSSLDEKVFAFENEFNGHQYKNFATEFIRNGADPSKLRQLLSLLVAYKDLKIKGQRALRKDETFVQSSEKHLLQLISYSIYGETMDDLIYKSLKCIEKNQSIKTLLDNKQLILDEQWQFLSKTEKADMRLKLLQERILVSSDDDISKKLVIPYLEQFYGSGSKILPLLLSTAIKDEIDAAFDSGIEAKEGEMSDDDSPKPNVEDRSLSFFCKTLISVSAHKTEDEARNMASEYRQELIGRDSRIFSAMPSLDRQDCETADYVSDLFDSLEDYYASSNRRRFWADVCEKAKHLWPSLNETLLRDAVSKEEPSIILKRLFGLNDISPLLLKAAVSYGKSVRISQVMPERFAMLAFRPDPNEVRRLESGDEEDELSLPLPTSGDSLSTYMLKLNYRVKQQLGIIFPTATPNENSEALVYAWALHKSDRYSQYVGSDFLWTILVGAVADQVLIAKSGVANNA